MLEKDLEKKMKCLINSINACHRNEINKVCIYNNILSIKNYTPSHINDKTVNS